MQTCAYCGGSRPRNSRFLSRDLPVPLKVYPCRDAKHRHCDLEMFCEYGSVGCYERRYTFTPTNDEVAIDATKTTANDMVALSLPSELACKSKLLQVPQMNFL